jgi:hypothetical protein
MPLAAVHIQAQHGHAQASPQAKGPRVVHKSSLWCAAFTEP